MSNKKQENAPIEGIVDGTDFVELKRDMQSAKVIAWLQYNQQQLIAGAVVFVLLLVGTSLWKEQQQAQKEAAALMYMKALNTADKTEQVALFDALIKDYEGSGYAVLAKLRKVADSDTASRKETLEQLVESKSAPEFSWQARLDLAELYLAEGEVDKVAAVLSSHFGTHYEQARYALLAKAASSSDEKMSLIQKALDAESHDNELTAELESQLAVLKAAQ